MVSDCTPSGTSLNTLIVPPAVALHASSAGMPASSHASFSNTWTGESPAVTADRDATVVTVESEFSVRYTKISGEWVRDLLETAGGEEVASGWWVLGQQTLAPRWFAAARVERMTSPGVGPLATLQDFGFTGFEETIGYRLTPDVTIRAGHRSRRGFFSTGFDNQLAASVVWWKRWW